MQLRPVNQIPSLIKALTEVVLPAIDPANTLAQEQARLVIATLGNILNRLPLEYRYDRDELQRSLRLSRRLRQLPGAGGTAAQALTEAEAAGAEVLERARAEPAELQEAVRSLRGAVGALIQSVYREPDAGLRESLRRLVDESAREQLLRERAWLVGFGFEPDPAQVPPVETLLAPLPG